MRPQKHTHTRPPIIVVLFEQYIREAEAHKQQKEERLQEAERDHNDAVTAVRQMDARLRDLGQFTSRPLLLVRHCPLHTKKFISCQLSVNLLCKLVSDLPSSFSSRC